MRKGESTPVLGLGDEKIMQRDENARERKRTAIFIAITQILISTFTKFYRR